VTASQQRIAAAVEQKVCPHAPGQHRAACLLPPWRLQPPRVTMRWSGYRPPLRLYCRGRVSQVFWLKMSQSSSIQALRNLF